MEYTIKSKILGRSVTFSIPGKSYIFVDLNHKPGTLGNQICRRGELTGDTLSYSGDDFEIFKKICQKWYKKHIKTERECYQI